MIARHYHQRVEYRKARRAKLRAQKLAARLRWLRNKSTVPLYDVVKDMFPDDVVHGEAL